MTTKYQKSLEMIYAKKIGELLGESWKVEPSPDEISWPDLIVITELGIFIIWCRSMIPIYRGGRIFRLWRDLAKF